MANDLEQRQDEILALSSIFDSDVFTVDAQCEVGQICVPIVLEKSAEVSFKDQSFTVAFLPPITLNFTFHPHYPSRSPPAFSLTCPWLTSFQIEELKLLLEKSWQENIGFPILFTWIEVLKDNAFKFAELPLNLDEISASTAPSTSSAPSPPGRGRGRLPIASPSVKLCRSSSVTPHFSATQLHHILLDFDETQKEATFRSSIFYCDVCFEKAQGKDCVQFTPCAHTFCVKCAGDFFKSKIEGGDVYGLRCLACESEASQKTIRLVVDEQLFERYDYLLYQRTIDSMLDIKRCPRPACESPVVIDASTPNLGECTLCGYAFCVYCRRASHGINECPVSEAEKFAIFEAYKTADRTARLELEQKHGRDKLRKLCDNMEAEAWVKANSKTCPNCKANIQKIEGCNKVECSKCRTPFCWLCLKKLHFTNPYGHFNNPFEKCYNKLFEGVEVVDDDDMRRPFGGGALRADVEELDALTDSDDDDDGQLIQVV